LDVFFFWLRVPAGGMLFESRPPRHEKHVRIFGRVFFLVARPRRGMLFKSRPPRHVNMLE